jgi:hypothetical protein
MLRDFLDKLARPKKIKTRNRTPLPMPAQPESFGDA